MNRVCLYLTSLVIVGLLFTSANLRAEPDKTFIIGVQNFKEYMPYSSISEKTRSFEKELYRGFNEKLLTMFAISKSYNFVYKPYSIKSLYVNLFNGAIDFKFPDNSYWAADIKSGKDIIYSRPVINYIDGVMVDPANKGKGLSRLKKLGVVNGFTPFAYLKQIKEGEIDVFYNHKYENLLLHVIKGRLDGAYINISVGYYYMKLSLRVPNTLVFDPDLPHTKSTRHFSTIKHPQVIEEFNHFLEKNHAAINQLKQKHNVEGPIQGY